MADIQEVVNVWKEYVDGIEDWEKLVKDVEPKATGCGPVYELAKPLDRPDEDFAIADMRDIAVAEPHYHPTGVTEIYIVIQGLGHIVVGGDEEDIQKGSVVVTPPNTCHFTIPKGNLVLAVINTPPFQPEGYIKIDPNTSKPEVGFDKNQFETLTHS